MSTDVPNTNTGSLLKRSELILAASLLGLLAVFIIPLPTIVLDILLSLNLSISIVLMLTVLTIKKPLDFSTFPSLLLLLTLFRLALNVATTRLVLLNGDAGEVVLAFGNFVVGGNLVVGLVVFAILIIIQFIVITRGAGRVSEVAARFTLDAIPGKQMAIDGELNAGLIDASEAKSRRAEVMRESEFYGTMDGASRFVRGDAIAGIIITAVNLVGGIIIGLMNGLSAGAAVKKYSILTIGDGLITQIPALIIATTSGILVTKASSESSLGQELGSQIQTSAAPLRLSSFIVMGLALVPGLPTIPFLILGGGLFFLSRRMQTVQQELAAKPATGASGTTTAGQAAGDEAPAKPTAETYANDFLQQDGVSLEIGRLLFPMLTTRRTPGLLDRITALRRELGRTDGLWVPGVRVTDNANLPPGGYRILIRSRAVAEGEVRPDMWLAMDTGAARFPLAGEDTTEPVFGLPAKWIPETEKSRAEMGEYSVVDAPAVIITHLGEIVRRYAHELLNREDLKALVDKVRDTSPAIVDELIPTLLTMGTLHKVISLLLAERVPISNLARIMESLSLHALSTKDPAELAERVRPDLGRAICERFLDPVTKQVPVMIFDPRLEVELRRGIVPNMPGQLAIEYTRQQQLTMRLKNEVDRAMARNREVALLCDSSIRRGIRNMLARTIPSLSVLAYQELPLDAVMDMVTVIKPEELAAIPTNFASLFESPPQS